MASQLMRGIAQFCLLFACTLSAFYLPAISRSAQASELASEMAPIADERTSIAVLPFTDSSPNQDQSFFSDGVTEEIFFALSQISNLKLAGRNEAFAYRNSATNLQLIGQKLDVDYILQGTVRRQEDRIRITTRLTSAHDGVGIWSYSFDRDAKDIFAIQEEIALSIADALKIILSKDEIALLAKKYTDNQTAYSLYLRGRSFQVARVRSNLPKAIALYEQAVSADPAYARAWAELALAHTLLPSYVETNMAEALATAESYAQKAIALDPDLSQSYAALGSIYAQRKDYLAMHAAYETALGLDRNNLDARHAYAISLIHVGRIAAAKEQYQFIWEKDPALPFGPMGLAMTNLLAGDLDEADKWGNEALNLGYLSAHWYLGEVAGLKGDADKAAQLISAVMQIGLVRAFTRDETKQMIYGFYNDPVAKRLALQKVQAFMANNDLRTEPQLPYFLLRLGDPQGAFDMFEKTPSPFGEIIYASIWGPVPASYQARQHPAFQTYVKNVGLVEYWQKYGWPDNCRPAEDKVICDR